jgi:hypothetical protein
MPRGKTMAIVHSPGQPLAPPAEVQAEIDNLRSQGWTIGTVTYKQCDRPQANGRSGWLIPLRKPGCYWEAWIFADDPLADVEAKHVDVEVC